VGALRVVLVVAALVLFVFALGEQSVFGLGLIKELALGGMALGVAILL